MKHRGSLLIASLVTIFVCGCTSTPADGLSTTTSSPWPSAASADIRTVLVTDDDGWDAAGITALYDALSTAGYDVTLVAPKDNWSGASMYALGGELSAGQSPDDPNKWWVAGTPVDSVRLALRGILESPPDVVVSGVNHGANAAYNVNYSGTVGAATAAAEQGVPAIAVSADVGANESNTNFAGAARSVVSLLQTLDDASLASMADGDVVNINVPVGKSKGTKVASQAEVEWTTTTYSPGSDGVWTPTASAVPGAASTSDKALIAAGYTTLTVLSVARDGSEQQHPELDAALDRLAD